jgi:predicted kinase
VVIGGLSGTGKSTLARMMAPGIGSAPGAVHLRSDEIRKQLAGVPMLQRLGPDGYSSKMSERVYGALVERAAQVLRSGHSVVVDAVYARSSERKRIEQVAIAEAVPFTGIWLEAPEPVLVSRTEQRRNDASDADPEIVRLQRGLDTGPIEWRRLDASGSASTVLSRAVDMLRGVGAGL